MEGVKGGYMFYAAFFGALSVWALVMALRPVLTDCGCFYPCCTIACTLGAKEYGAGVGILIILGAVFGMIVSRIVMERRAVMARVSDGE